MSRRWRWGGRGRSWVRDYSRRLFLFFSPSCVSVLTSSQRAIFNQVKAFVLEHRSPGSVEHQRKSRLTMPNTIPAADRKFVTDLADDLHLSITWDEYDDDDQNLITWRFPGELEELVPENGGSDDKGGEQGDDDEAWEDEEDEESRAAVDRVLQKYEKAKVKEDDKEGDFDARYEQSVKEKMDEWKRGYYKVCPLLLRRSEYLHEAPRRANWRSAMTNRRTCLISFIDISRACSGSCTTITVASHHGAGSTTTITRHEYQVRAPIPMVVLAN